MVQVEPKSWLVRCGGGRMGGRGGDGETRVSAFGLYGIGSLAAAFYVKQSS